MGYHKLKEYCEDFRKELCFLYLGVVGIESTQIYHNYWSKAMISPADVYGSRLLNQYLNTINDSANELLWMGNVLSLH